MDEKFQNNILLTQTERLTMNGRPANPKYARNKNVLVIGGSGSGKTRFYVKPNLMQMHSSYVKVIVSVFLTNGSGEAWAANPIYTELIKNFDAKQSFIALTSFMDESIRSKLQFPLCQKKFTEKIIYNQYKQSIGQILRQLCSYKGVEILEGHLMPDHVNMLVSIPPKISVSQFMGYLKGKSALMIFDKHANLKYKFGNRHFWSEGYYVSTVGLNKVTIKKYIQEQEKHDVAMDKLSVKEYEDPFRDGK